MCRYHDVIDSRWRRVQNLFLFWLLYSFLFVSVGGVLVYYIVVQCIEGDYKETGASIVALIIGAYGFWKLLRIRKILNAHKNIISGPVAAANVLISSILPEEAPVDLTIHYFDRPHLNRIDISETQGMARFEYLSATLFDDDFPGDGTARIRWLSWTGHIEVVDEDAEEAATRLALFMRFALRSPRREFWTLICQTNPLITSVPERVSLGKMLRRLIISGSNIPTPKHVHPNPVEELLNDEISLEELGVAMFWITTDESNDEVSVAMSSFPQKWMRSVRQDGTQLIFETSMFLILADKLTEMQRRPSMKEHFCARVGADSLIGDINPLCATPYLREVRVDGQEAMKKTPSWELSFRNDSERAPVTIACSEALAAYLHGSDIMKEEANNSYVALERLCTDVVSEWFENLCRPCVIPVKGESTTDGVFIGMAIVELLRTSDHAGHIAEAVIGPLLVPEIISNISGAATIARSEIVWGLAAIVTSLSIGTDSPELVSFMESLKVEWNIEEENCPSIFVALKRWIENWKDLRRNPVVSGALWMITGTFERCSDPFEAFYMHAECAKILAAWVFRALRAWNRQVMTSCTEENCASAERQGPVIYFPKKFGDPQEFHDNWVGWKLRKQGREEKYCSTYTLDGRRTLSSLI